MLEMMGQQQGLLQLVINTLKLFVNTPLAGFRCQYLAQNGAGGEAQRAPRADGPEENHLRAGRNAAGRAALAHKQGQTKKKAFFCRPNTERALFPVCTKVREITSPRGGRIRHLNKPIGCSVPASPQTQ